MEDTNTVIKWILASVSMIAGILILQPYGLLFFGVACMIISFLIVNSIDDSKPINWNKVWRDSDNKFNRMVMYDANMIHCAEGAGDERLTLAFFVYSGK